jgi:Mn2+/Fe2+ NRAMP family transporter
MGVYVNGRLTSAAAIAVSVLIAGLNVYLLASNVI